MASAAGRSDGGSLMPKIRKDRFTSPKGPGVRVFSREEMLALEKRKKDDLPKGI